MTKYEPIRILVVDDDEGDFLLVSYLFEEIDDISFVLEWAETFEAALEAISQRQHDAYLFDNYLGGHTGLELLRELKAQGSPIPVIMLTGLGDRALDLEAMDAGAMDYLVKHELDAQTLERTIRYAITQKQAQEALRNAHRELEQRTEALSEMNERLQVEVAQRIKAERLKTEFLSVVSHELRTPLTSISGSLALMAAGVTGALPAQADAMIEIAHRNSERLVRLINDLLDLQKIESGMMPLKLEPLEVLPLVEQVMQANYAYGSRYGVTYKMDEGGLDLWVHADADRLMQVLTNLLSNAAKFSPAESTVEISVKRNNGHVRVSVADRGPGIPEEYQDCVFGKFTQVDASSSRQKEGTGLGLSISKAIVEMHGGRIAFDTVPDRGTTFYFDLPEWHDSGDGSLRQESEPQRRFGKSFRAAQGSFRSSDERFSARSAATNRKSRSSLE